MAAAHSVSNYHRNQYCVVVNWVLGISLSEFFSKYTHFLLRKLNQKCRKSFYKMVTIWSRRQCFNTSQNHRSLQWRHNERDGVSNHQPCDCLLNCLFRRISKKTSKLRVTGLCAGNSPVTGKFPAQRASNAKNVSIWWRHHVVLWWQQAGCKTLQEVISIFSKNIPSIASFPLTLEHQSHFCRHDVIWTSWRLESLFDIVLISSEELSAWTKKKTPKLCFTDMTVGNPPLTRSQWFGKKSMSWRYHLTDTTCRALCKISKPFGKW